MSSETFDLAWNVFRADYPNSAGGLQPQSDDAGRCHRGWSGHGGRVLGMLSP